MVPQVPAQAGNVTSRPPIKAVVDNRQCSDMVGLLVCGGLTLGGGNEHHLKREDDAGQSSGGPGTTVTGTGLAASTASATFSPAPSTMASQP